MHSPPRRRRPLAVAGLFLLPALCAAFLALIARGDRAERSASPEGLQENPPSVHAFVNARLVLSAGRVVEKGTVVFRDGVIEAVGDDIKPPADARIWDLTGKTVYPGLIDAYSELSDTPPDADTPPGEMLRPVGGAGYWNPFVTPQFRASDAYKSDPETNKKLRSQGVVARLVVPSRQIVKGSSVAVTTDDSPSTDTVLQPMVGMHVRLTPAAKRGDDRVYPNSPMGALSLVRQAILDARWYDKTRSAWDTDRSFSRPEHNDALAALVPAAKGKMPLFVDAPDELYALRADLLGKEFEIPIVIRGSGQEYRRLQLIADAKRAVIVPVNFAKAPNVASPEAALAVSLDELMDWDLQPENPARLEKAGVKIALTSHGLKDKSGFLAAVRKAVKRGLPREAALRSLTATPAELIGIDKTHGSIDRGKSASFLVTDGDLFADKTLVLATWVDGRRHEVTPSLSPDPRGVWVLNWGAGDTKRTLSVRITGTAVKLAGTIVLTTLAAGEAATRPARAPTAVATGAAAATRPSPTALAHIDYAPGQITFTIKAERSGEAFDRLGMAGVAQVSGTIIGDEWSGRMVLPDGTTFPLAGKRTSAAQEGDKKPVDPESAEGAKSQAASGPAPQSKNDPTTRPSSFDINYPLGSRGTTTPPQKRRVLFQNATVWTSGPKGKLASASVLIEDGRIVTVFENGSLPEPDANLKVVDCTGLHLSPGIIDCHSHIATDGGINESGRAVTCNVRIGDFIDPDDISIYRQLAGGVTSSNILHGSANPIGGQNQVIKLRWGAGPEQMKFQDAAPGVKFALGENVKQANWGEKFTSRYPQTRLGVEQIIRDRFTAAREYHQAHERYKSTAVGVPPRIDLELEAMWEIVSGKRLIHCHSYRQDEILALLRVCEEFGVKIATLQHILEGYKVADAIAKHGAGASSFSDWWAYKLEVYDAIPYNGQLLRDAGVLVSFNSDDAEMARRLNLEAAKAVKYGGVPEVEALKFVTLNPAKQLRIDDRVGSIEPGKDADLVLWSGSPLSTMSRVNETWIDGRLYFSRTDDQKMRQRDAERRTTLIQKILSGDAAVADDKDKEPRERDKWAREDLYCGCRVEGGK
ncbi:amidohydrolase family protein [Humisphaera borealis]|uniref:Amidohydrolase family protein n=1 Tax=Humisphaera borealis TaxID=2807512 RepID=A0A7M2WT10_9BACT|nr:amidohydrolase family protein [Humisphaera borealis]QOV88647.1 amidohydrolase family protein [Humisphaera borealis]